MALRGYNNIDLDACRNKGIRVCNVPTYATEAMAHIAITLVMALSCSLVPQAKAFAKGDRSYLTQCHLGSLAHFELTDKRIGLIGGLGTIVSICFYYRYNRRFCCRCCSAMVLVSAIVIP